MNLFIAYAKIPMAFLNWYRQRNAHASFKVAIGIAMTSTLLVNIWSLVLFLSLVNRGWLASRPRITVIEYTALVVGALIAELLFVDFVQNKVAHDAAFAARVGNANPSIAIRYLVSSVAALALSTLLAIVLN